MEIRPLASAKAPAAAARPAPRMQLKASAEGRSRRSGPIGRPTASVTQKGAVPMQAEAKGRADAATSRRSHAKGSGEDDGWGEGSSEGVPLLHPAPDDPNRSTSPDQQHRRIDDPPVPPPDDSAWSVALSNQTIERPHTGLLQNVATSAPTPSEIPPPGGSLGGESGGAASGGRASPSGSRGASRRSSSRGEGQVDAELKHLLNIYVRCVRGREGPPRSSLNHRLQLTPPSPSPLPLPSFFSS